jgi:DNA-binding Lrp family transcriptional regulator
MSEAVLDALDRAIVNRLQAGFPVCERPYLAEADALGITESDLIARLERLLADKVLTRFGPLYQIERAGGAFVLAAMKVPEADVERVAALVNRWPEVAHNYLREHRFNLWFVLAAESLGRIDDVISAIEEESGYPVYAMPKLKEYFLELRLAV